MLEDTDIFKISVHSVMVKDGWRISFSASISLVSCSILLDRAVNDELHHDIILGYIIGFHEIQLSILDPTPRKTIESYLTPLRHEHASMASELADIIEEHLPLLRAKAERAMKAAQAELDLPPESKFRWKKGDRVTSADRPATVKKTYPSGCVWIVLDPRPKYGEYSQKGTRIVSAKTLEPLEG